MEVLKAGYPLLLFPEGGRRLDPRRQWEARAGVGMLAAKTAASVIPVGIKNAEHLKRLALRLKCALENRSFRHRRMPIAESYQRLTRTSS